MVENISKDARAQEYRATERVSQTGLEREKWLQRLMLYLP